MSFDPNLFTEACVLIYGRVGWMDAAAGELDVTRRTIERWVAGERAPANPAEIFDTLHRRAVDQGAKLRQLADRLRRH